MFQTIRSIVTLMTFRCEIGRDFYPGRRTAKEQRGRHLKNSAASPQLHVVYSSIFFPLYHSRFSSLSFEILLSTASHSPLYHFTFFFLPLHILLSTTPHSPPYIAPQMKLRRRTLGLLNILIQVNLIFVSRIFLALIGYKNL